MRGAARIESRRSHAPAKRAAPVHELKDPFLLRGLLICDECKKTMTTSMGRGKITARSAAKAPRYYRCRTLGCSTGQVAAATVESLVDPKLHAHRSMFLPSVREKPASSTNAGRFAGPVAVAKRSALVNVSALDHGRAGGRLANVSTTAYNASVKFEWDETKNIKNFEKHRIWFEEAQTIWADAHATEFFDPDHSESEDRFIRVGYSRANRILVIVFCERHERSLVRIISARKATPKEKKAHEEGI